jgi:hypothetical protein
VGESTTRFGVAPARIDDSDAARVVGREFGEAEHQLFVVLVSYSTSIVHNPVSCFDSSRFARLTVPDSLVQYGCSRLGRHGGSSLLCSTGCSRVVVHGCVRIGDL